MLATEPSLLFCVLQGKVFPKLRKRSSAARLVDQDGNEEEQTAADYVFRIVYPGYRYDASKCSSRAAESVASCSVMVGGAWCFSPGSAEVALF